MVPKDHNLCKNKKYTYTKAKQDKELMLLDSNYKKADFNKLAQKAAAFIKIGEKGVKSFTIGILGFVSEKIREMATGKKIVCFEEIYASILCKTALNTTFDIKGFQNSN